MKYFLLLILICCNVEAQTFTNLPMPEGSIPPTDPELINLKWHRWETKNFVIMSVEEGQGLWLYKNIEQVKTWIFTRWGLPDIDFPKRIYLPEFGYEPGCMVLCVPRKEMMLRIWKKSSPYYEVRKDGKKITLNFILLVLDKNPAQSIPGPLTVSCLKELENGLDVECSLAVMRGIASLNETIPQIKEKIRFLGRQLETDQKMFFGKSLLSMQERDWRSAASDQQYAYDAEALVFCLMLRKEFGQDKFVKFRGPNFKDIYKFENFDKFDVKFKTYVKHLAEDINANRTPDNYLVVRNKGE